MKADMTHGSNNDDLQELQRVSPETFNMHQLRYIKTSDITADRATPQTSDITEGC